MVCGKTQQFHCDCPTKCKFKTVRKQRRKMSAIIKISEYSDWLRDLKQQIKTGRNNPLGLHLSVEKNVSNRTCIPLGMQPDDNHLLTNKGMHSCGMRMIYSAFSTERDIPNGMQYNNKQSNIMSKTFTEELIKRYEIACTENKGQAEYYCCVSSNGKIIPRSLKLDSKYVFCNVKYEKEKSKNNVILEYKLAAFLIKKALEDENWLLPIKGKKWRLLDAERNFADVDISEENKGKGKRLDILAYEEETKSYIVIELKVNRAFTTADNELRCYTDTIEKMMNEANNVYSVKAENVKGYIVWNAPKGNRNPIDNQWGMIEYDIDVLKDGVEKLEFLIKTEPTFIKKEKL